MSIKVDKLIEALRYLLLQHLKELSNKGLISPTTQKEIASTLHILRNETQYRIAWQREGMNFQHVYDRNDFSFYTRGDAQLEKSNPLPRNNNNKLAEQWATEAAGLKSNADSRKKTKVSLPEVIEAVCLVGIVVILATQEGPSGFLVGGIFLSAYAIELFGLTSKIVSILLLLLIAASAPYAVSIFALTFALFQFLDPRKSLRMVRTFAGLSVFGHTLFTNRFLSLPELSLTAALVVIAGILIFGLRWINGTHRRTFTVCLPLFLIGIYLDDYKRSAVLGLMLLLAEQLIKGWLAFRGTLKFTSFPAGFWLFEPPHNRRVPLN